MGKGGGAVEGGAPEGDEMEWDPDWDLDPAALQYADPELDGEPQASTMDLGSTAYLLTLKGSLVSVLTYSDTSELYTTLMTKLEQAVPEEDREDFAALVIQRSWRRVTRVRKARAERDKRRIQSVEKLQSTYRGHLTRRFIVKLHLSAARIQALGRGWKTRRRLWLEKKEKMCSKIQKWYRACLARDLLNKMRREMGTKTLQRVYRGHMGRREYKFRRETRAAGKIQRVTRGHNGRKSAQAEMERLSEIKERRRIRCAIMIQSVARSYMCRRVLKRRYPSLRLARRIRMAVRLQRTYRGYRGRVRFRVHGQLKLVDVYNLSIRPIQALGRGHIVRQRRRDELERLAEEEAMRLASALTQMAQHRASRVFAHCWQRYTLRKYEWVINKLVARIQIWYRLRNMSFMGKLYRAKVGRCATKIQACVAGHLTRNQVRELRSNRMATRLQATWRGHVGRGKAEQWIAQVMEKRELDSRRRRELRRKHEHAMSILAQSARGSLEVFKNAEAPPDPMARSAQIVPSYMKEVALNQQRTLDPKLDRAVLRAPAMKTYQPGDAAPSTMPARVSDELGWEGSEPSMDPFPANLPAHGVTGDAGLDMVYRNVSTGRRVASEGGSLLASPRTFGEAEGHYGGEGMSKTMPAERGGVRFSTEEEEDRGVVGTRPSKEARRRKRREIWQIGQGTVQILPSYIAKPMMGGSAPLVKFGGLRRASVNVGYEEPLLPSEIAHRSRMDRIEAKLGFEDGRGNWHWTKRPNSATGLRERMEGGIEQSAQLYTQDLVHSRAVRQRFGLAGQKEKMTRLSASMTRLYSPRDSCGEEERAVLPPIAPVARRR